MIAIVTVGSTFEGTCRYVFEKSKDIRHAAALIAHTTMGGRDHRELAAEFIAHRELHPALGRAVAHIVLRPAAGEHLSVGQWKTLICQVLERMDFGDAPRVAALHTARDGQTHAHIVASRIRGDGSVVPDAYSYTRLMAILRDIEVEHGFQQPRSVRGGSARLTRAEEEMGVRLDEIPPKIILLERILVAIERSDGTRGSYLHQLAGLQVAARPTLDRDRKVLGYSYELLDHQGEMVRAFAGRKIRADLGLRGLGQHLAERRLVYERGRQTTGGVDPTGARGDAHGEPIPRSDDGRGRLATRSERSDGGPGDRGHPGSGGTADGDARGARGAADGGDRRPAGDAGRGAAVGGRRVPIAAPEDDRGSRPGRQADGAGEGRAAGHADGSAGGGPAGPVGGLHGRDRGAGDGRDPGPAAGAGGPDREAGPGEPAGAALGRADSAGHARALGDDPVGSPRLAGPGDGGAARDPGSAGPALPGPGAAAGIPALARPAGLGPALQIPLWASGQIPHSAEGPYSHTGTPPYGAPPRGQPGPEPELGEDPIRLARIYAEARARPAPDGSDPALAAASLLVAALRQEGCPEPTGAAHEIIRRIEAALGQPDAPGRADDLIRRMVAIDAFATAATQADALPAAGRDARLAAIAAELAGRIPSARADLEQALHAATVARPTPSRQQPAPGPDRPRGPRSGGGRGGR